MIGRILLGALALLVAGCEMIARPIPPLAESGKLVVVTLNGPATWYEDAQGRPDGFEHDLVTLFAKDLGADVQYDFVDSPEKAQEALKAKRAHIAAALLPVSSFRLPGGLAWGPAYRTAQYQLVWRATFPRPRAPRDLAGTRVGLVPGYPEDPVLAAAAKLPATIEHLPPDTSPEDLLQRVVDGRLDGAIIDSARFGVERKHFPQLEVAFDVGKPVEFAWRVGYVDRSLLLDKMKVFFARIERDGTLRRLAERHFAHVTRISPIDSGTLLERVNTVLPKLKPLFQEAERVSGFDWRLIAAIGYQESHWDPLATSPTGVRGLMMLTEETADRLKVRDRLDPRESILGGPHVARARRLQPRHRPPRGRAHPGAAKGPVAGLLAGREVGTAGPGGPARLPDPRARLRARPRGDAVRGQRAQLPGHPRARGAPRRPAAAAPGARPGSGRFRDARPGEVSRVGPRLHPPAARLADQRVVGGIGNRDGVRGPDRDAVHVAVEHREHAAVAHHRERAALALGGEGLEGVAHALVHLAPALAAGHHVVGIGLAHAGEDLRVVHADLPVREPLGEAVVALAKARVRHDRVPGRRRDRLRGAHGAAEVARDEPVEALAGEPPRDGRRLRLAGRGERAVGVSLDAGGEVPLGLAVADDDQPRAQARAILSTPPM
jgi:membrane-bound lytic murein transglycosylase F